LGQEVADAHESGLPAGIVLVGATEAGPEAEIKTGAATEGETAEVTAAGGAALARGVVSEKASPTSSSSSPAP